MATTLQSSTARVFSFPTISKRKPPRNRPSVLSVMTPPTSVTISTTPKTVYRDNWIERLAISYLSETIQKTSGVKNNTDGYKGIVEVSSAMFQEFSPTQQRQLILKVLENAIPSFGLVMIRNMSWQSKFGREFCAIFTTFAFPWLVGPSEVKESEYEGRKEKNVVHIKKCRFLEESNCVGMCTNLCKMPTQEFIKKNFGVPVNMVPNFDDMSCEIIFGQDPPAEEDDQAFKQPCYKLCNVKKKHSGSCII